MGVYSGQHPRFGYRQVKASPEFARVLALPRRPGDERGIDIQGYTDVLKKPKGQMTLWPRQAWALAEARAAGGGLFALGVGEGKTLVSLLLPTILAARRPLILIPAALKEKTLEHDFPHLIEHWHIQPTLNFETYESLSRNPDALDEFEPDLIVADEAHKLSQYRSGRTRRFQRYMREHPATRFVAMTGSLTRRSIRDYASLAAYALRDGSPLPRTWDDIQDWADALDESPRDRANPGALLKLVGVGETVRQGYQRRLSETRGVVISQAPKCDAAIQIHFVRPGLPRDISEALTRLNRLWETPGGEELSEPLELWRHLRDLSWGFYQRWVWPDGEPDFDWLSARAAWKKFVREDLRHNRVGRDTELQVLHAVRNGRLASRQLIAWDDVKDSYKPQNEAVWINDALVRAAAHALQNSEPALVWVSADALGQRLSELSGAPFFAAGKGQSSILPHKGSTVILSTHSQREGNNLQDWHHNVVLTSPRSGAQWEQLLGRTHREGQQSPVVTCTLYAHAAPLVEAFDAALSDAGYISDTLGQPQKLLYATIHRDKTHADTDDTNHQSQA